MILQALVNYYEALEKQGKIAAPGWGPVNISYVLHINEEGELEQVSCVKQEVVRGKKTVLLPQVMQLPAPEKRSVGIRPNFLWDNSSYLLGIDEKGKPERTLKCWEASKAWHEQVLKDVGSPATKALLSFFAHWEPEKVREHPALQDDLEDIMAGANLTFRFHGEYLYEDLAIRTAWQSAQGEMGDGEEGVCLVTGKHMKLANLHPAIKGVAGAQSSGASLVSFNAPAFCSYGHEQGMNAPTGEYAAFAYGAALNYLLSDRDHVSRIGDTTVLCWAQGGEAAYQGLFAFSVFGQASNYDEHDLQEILKKLVSGTPVDFDETRIDPDKPFYVLGLSPNAARLSVRFFLKNSFRNILENVQKHYEDMKIERPVHDTLETVPVWKMLRETINPNAKDKTPTPGMSGEVLRSILNGTPYPATMRNGIHLRIRADHVINRERAGIIKAYYLRKPSKEFPNPKEVFTVSLNPESKNVPYQLGRMFSVLEAIQSAANPGINTTIRDRYFSSASATPAIVFPTLNRLAQKHFRKMDGGLATMYKKQLQEIADKLEDTFPAKLTLPEQGSFQLGYYHQTLARYQRNKKED